MRDPAFASIRSRASGAGKQPFGLFSFSNNNERCIRVTVHTHLIRFFAATALSPCAFSPRPHSHPCASDHIANLRRRHYRTQGAEANLPHTLLTTKKGRPGLLDKLPALTAICHSIRFASQTPSPLPFHFWNAAPRIRAKERDSGPNARSRYKRRGEGDRESRGMTQP